MKLLTIFPVAIAIGTISLVGCNEIETRPPTSSQATGTPEVAATTPPKPASAPKVAATPSPQPKTASTPPKTVDIEIVSCQITMAQVNDPDGAANVRSQPDTNANNIVGKLTNGTMVTVESQANGWFQITNPVAGWIAQSRTDNSCTQKVAQVNFPRGSISFELRDRILGSGSHRYTFETSPGQRLTLTAREGPLPIVLTPDGGELNADAASNGASTWTGQLAAPGKYTLDFPSNFRGFTYETLVQIE